MKAWLKIFFDCGSAQSIMTPHFLCSFKSDPSQFTQYAFKHMGMIYLVQSFYKQKTLRFVRDIPLDLPRLLQTIAISEYQCTFW